MWKGVILEESLEDKKILSLVKIIKTDVERLEGENRILTFHKIELEDKNQGKFVKLAEKDIKPAFYLHICKNNEMIVIFRSKFFKFDGNNLEKLNEARDYGVSIGILEVQMPFEKLIKDPWS